MTDRQPAWIANQRKRSAEAAQRVRARIATLDNDRLFWIDFDSSGERAFNRILCRKVGDAASYRVELSWQSMSDSPIADLRWSAPTQTPYPPNNCNETMRLVDMEPRLEAKLAMLMHHEHFDLVRTLCFQTYNNELLCRRVREGEAEKDDLT